MFLLFIYQRVMIFKKHISGEELRCFYFKPKNVAIQQKPQKSNIEKNVDFSRYDSNFSKRRKGLAAESPFSGSKKPPGKIPGGGLSPTGFEPMAFRLGGGCSILLSYGDMRVQSTLR